MSETSLVLEGDSRGEANEFGGVPMIVDVPWYVYPVWLTAEGGSSKWASVWGRLEASLPLMSVEGAGVGGKVVAGILAVA